MSMPVFARAWRFGARRSGTPSSRPLDRGAALYENLRPLILAEEESTRDKYAPPKYPFVGDMVGNTICADLLDYLQGITSSRGFR
jgi:hypothetical protein